MSVIKKISWFILQGFCMCLGAGFGFIVGAGLISLVISFLTLCATMSISTAWDVFLFLSDSNVVLIDYAHMFARASGGVFAVIGLVAVHGMFHEDSWGF